MELATQRWGSTVSENAQKTPSKSSAKPRLLFLHGMGGTGLLWRPVAAVLEDEFEILAPDQRGHGKSQIPAIPGSREKPGYSPIEYAQDVVDTMDAQGFHPSILIGHSMGVRTACALAHLRPEWVRGLILVDLGLEGLAGGGLGEGLARFIRILPESFPSREAARSFMSENCPDGSIAQYLMAVSVARPADAGGGITFPFDHSALLSTIEAARGTSIRHWVIETARRGIPVLLLRGERSQVWSREDFEAAKRELTSVPGVELQEIQGAGHGLPFEKRAEFTALIRQFSQAHASG